MNARESYPHLARLAAVHRTQADLRDQDASDALNEIDDLRAIVGAARVIAGMRASEDVGYLHPCCHTLKFDREAQSAALDRLVEAFGDDL